MKKILNMACKASNVLTTSLDWCVPFVALGIRFYITSIFLWSGWLKITAWSSTLVLFRYEYKIVVLSPIAAAYIGTAAEIILPILLILGLGARLPAVLLFIFNVFNVLFYPILLTPAFECALKDHILWGILIGIIVFYGSGKFSVDYFLQKRVCEEYKY